ncbi:molybdopterin biosynthesis protein MoeB [Pseudobythopirellula maris]|uniref:Molybdopterin biosynthesis protein MoeB n=1 Tax=Pseudobythopirellula maris TaxID=2527991 RepID=A0A5C5ZS66_9BACT|nr:rhodanese-like domain-containing protein [Pseudobythopirellula maris]TWT90374.1 molybdopterin biosynthesis protein MoeB [Pseudobythopirellula maris]
MKKIDADQLRSMFDNNADFLLINTLSADNFAKTKIEGAVNIPQDQDQFVSEVESRAADKSTPIVVYCASADCNSSDKAAEKLDAAGFTNVMDFAEGAAGWQNEPATAPN